MTPEQALKNLAQAVRAIQANADIHDALAESVRVLAEALDLKPKEAEE